MEPTHSKSQKLCYFSCFCPTYNILAAYSRHFIKPIRAIKSYGNENFFQFHLTFSPKRGTIYF